MEQINKEIYRFIEFLNSNWDRLEKDLSLMIYRDELQLADIVNDWLEVNWEIILESMICRPGEYIVAYGAGADCFSDSYRVRYPYKNATFQIKCVPKKGDKVFDLLTNKKISLSDKEFYKFVCFKNEIYIDAVPFNHTLLQDSKGEFYVVENVEISFVKERVDEEI